MAKHRLDGRWNYFEMPDGADVPTPGRLMTLTIPDESGRVDEDNSNHAGFPVDGDASNTRLDLVRTGPGNNRRTLAGTVVFDKRIDDVDHIVIVGRFVDESTVPVTTSQIEGTWIVSKP